MKCQQCQHENDASAKFCEDCGAKLARSCPSCGQGLKASAKFCTNCGHRSDEAGPERPTPASYTPRHLADKILGSRSAMEGERKQVTVLFADIQGSMELAEQIDAEEWHAILDRFFGILTAGVHRFEGTVNQYTGDGIMALFGAPISHEDHAQRACWAGLHLRDQLQAYADELRMEHGLNFAFRMGINSGEVVVGKIGDDLRMDYTAQGHTVGLAARMEQIAAADSVYLTADTARLVEGYFTLRDVGKSRIKGVTEPVEVFALEAAGAISTRFDVSRARGLSRFVGRTDEMATLESALEQAKEATGQVVGVVAQAGTGKSRLCFEFLERCRAREIQTYEAHCVPHGKAVPLQPVFEFMRSVFGIGDGDSPRIARDKVAGRIVLEDRTLTDELPVLFGFLGIADAEHPAPSLEPQVLQRKLIEIMGRLSAARSKREEPAVVLVEDLHWLDEASEAFVSALVTGIGAARMLVVLNMRPEYEAPWTGLSHYRKIPLAPLRAAEIAELVRELLGNDPELEQLAGMIEARTGGNPFFIEEVVRELAERGVLEGGPGQYRLTAAVEELSVPASVQGVLAARIDRLTPPQKEVLQAASVVGRTFPLDLLEAGCELDRAGTERTVAELVSAEFVYPESLYPVPEWSFKHSLTRDVAYESLLGERRRSLHCVIAEALEAKQETKGHEASALLAHHYEAAGDVGKAIQWHRAAATWIGPRDERECYRHWARVRSLLEQLPETAETISGAVEALNHMAFRGLRAQVSDLDIDALLSEARSLAGRSAKPSDEILVDANVGALAYARGDLTAAARILNEAVDRARALGSHRLVSTIFPWWQISATLHGPTSRVLTTVEAVGRLDQEGVRTTMGVDARGWMQAFNGLSLAYAGRLQEARDVANKALSYYTAKHGDASALSGCETVLASVTLSSGEVASAIGHGRRAVEFAERNCSNVLVANAYFQFTRALVADGRTEEAVAPLERLEEVTSVGPHKVTPLVLRAYLLRLQGRLDEALEGIAEAIDVLRRIGLMLFVPDAELARFRVLLAMRGADARDDLESTLARAMQVIEEREFFVYVPRVHGARADLCGVLGDTAARRRELQLALEKSREIGAYGYAASYEKLLAE